MKNMNEIGIGSFRPGREPHGRHNQALGVMGPTANADGVISQRMQYNVGNYDYDEFQLDNEQDENEDVILECRVYRRGKYCLVETLDNLKEFPDYAGNFKHKMKQISNSAKDRTNDIDEPLDEFSGAAAAGGGPAVPLGRVLIHLATPRLRRCAWRRARCRVLPASARERVSWPPPSMPAPRNSGSR